MQLLLDTHALIWWLSKDSNMKPQAVKAISDPDNVVFVSAACAWEIGIKKSLGKLSAPDDLKAQIEKKRFVHLPINIDHTLLVETLPKHHRDPFDRILIAQGICECLTIVTRDDKFLHYEVKLLEI